MNAENIDNLLGAFAKLSQAPQTYKKGLANLLNQTDIPFEDLTIGDFLKLAGALTAAHKKNDTTIAEHCLFHGNGTIQEKTALIANILSERAGKLGAQRQDLDAAVSLARIYLENGKSGSTALMHGYGILLNRSIPQQAA